jgi:hypothetical protein
MLRRVGLELNLPRTDQFVLDARRQGSTSGNFTKKVSQASRNSRDPNTIRIPAKRLFMESFSRNGRPPPDHLHTFDTQSSPGPQSCCFVHSGSASATLMQIPPSHTGIRASISLHDSPSVHGYLQYPSTHTCVTLQTLGSFAQGRVGCGSSMHVPVAPLHISFGAHSSFVTHPP